MNKLKIPYQSLFITKTVFEQSSFYQNKVLLSNLPHLKLGEVPCFINEYCFKYEQTLMTLFLQKIQKELFIKKKIKKYAE